MKTIENLQGKIDAVCEPLNYKYDYEKGGILPIDLNIYDKQTKNLNRLSTQLDKLIQVLEAIAVSE